MLSPDWRPPKPHVAIVGGGLAGLAAAAALVGRDLRVTLIEGRPRLGGRASSFPDPTTGELVDNCQHVSMACCTNLADFCGRVGVADRFRRDPAVVFLDEAGRASTLAPGRLPAPFHLTGSFLKARYLTVAEKLRVGYGLACLRFAGGDGRPAEPFESWLLRHGQTRRTIDRFWATVLVSALNERLDRMDLGHARKVFLDGFLRSREAPELEIPTVPLGELYGRPLETWLEANGVEVRLTTGARRVELDEDGGLAGIGLRSGESVAADFVVVATPFDRVAGLVGPELADRLPGLDAVQRLESTPITGIHLWLDRPVCPLDHAVLVGKTVQWVFNHSALQGRGLPDGTAGGQYLQLVVSAAYDLQGLDKAAIVELALADLAGLWPAIRAAKLVRSWVVTEHGATFSVRPGVEALRPPQRTPVDGLYLAGDWTDTGWPATMEGAVRSGYLAAEGILRDLGRPERLVVPELPDSWLARLLLGRRRPLTPVRPKLPQRASVHRPLASPPAAAGT